MAASGMYLYILFGKKNKTQLVFNWMEMEIWICIFFMFRWAIVSRCGSNRKAKRKTLKWNCILLLFCSGQMKMCAPGTSNETLSCRLADCHFQCIIIYLVSSGFDRLINLNASSVCTSELAFLIKSLCERTHASARQRGCPRALAPCKWKHSHYVRDSVIGVRVHSIQVRTGRTAQSDWSLSQLPSTRREGDT